MPAYAIYEPSTGAISSTLIISNVEGAVLETLVAANTPSGKSVLDVTDSSHPVLINSSGWVVTDGAIAAVPPTDAELLANAKAIQLADLQVNYENAKAANVNYMGTSFFADPDSQQLFAHALLAYQSAGATPSGFFTVDANGSPVSMNLSQLQGLIQTIAAQVWAVFQRWVQVRQALAAAATVPDVTAITW